MFLDTSQLKTEELFLKLERTAAAVPGRDWADSYYFTITLADGTAVGECTFRIGNTEKLFFGGNIGYTVFPPYQGNHYAGKACLLLLNLARRHGMEYLYITCNPDNLPSRKTCEYAGGILTAIVDLPTDNEMYRQGERKKCVYRFSLLPPASGNQPKENIFI